MKRFQTVPFNSICAALSRGLRLVELDQAGRASPIVWDGGSGFGRIRWRVGFGRIRADSEQLRRVFLCGIVQSVWAF